MNNSLLRSIRFLHAFSKNKDFIKPRGTWNPHQQADKQQINNQEQKQETQSKTQITEEQQKQSQSRQRKNEYSQQDQYQQRKKDFQQQDQYSQRKNQYQQQDQQSQYNKRDSEGDKWTSKQNQFREQKKQWNPSQNESKPRQNVEDESEDSTKILFKPQIKTQIQIQHGMFLDTKLPPQKVQSLTFEKIAQLQSQPDSVQKFASLIQAAAESSEDYEKYFVQAKQFRNDPLIINTYFKAIIIGNEGINQKQEKLKQILENQQKSLDNRSLVMYFELIFKTTKLPSEKGRELMDLLLLIKRQNIQIKTFDIDNFCYVFNHELFKQYEQEYEQLVKVFADYVEYVWSNQQDSQQLRLTNINVAFQICRLVSEKYGLLFQLDPCFRIIKAVDKRYEIISASELAQWANRYLNHDQGLQVVMEAFKNIDSYSVGKELDKIVNNTQSLRSVQYLRQQYQLLRSPISVSQLDVIAILAERKKDWNVLADVYLMYNSYTRNKNRSQIIYLSSISMAIALEGKNHVDSVAQLISKAQQDNCNLQRIQVDISNVKAMIKDGMYETAFSFFRNQVIDETIVEYQRERIRQFLIKYVEFIAIEHDKEVDQYLFKRANNFANYLPISILQKLYVEDMSDNQVLEAITFAESPWDFWEEVQKYKDFQWLRQECLQQTLNPKLLLNLSQNDTFWIRRRDVLENYEQYLEQEKQNRIAIRRQSRLLKILEELPFSFTADFEDEEIDEQIEKELGTQLDKNLFGKKELEFPELDFMNEMRDLIRKEEKKQGKVIQTQTPKIVSNYFNRFEPQETQKVVDIPEDNKNISAEQQLLNWLDDTSQPYPSLEEPLLREKFIQLFYQQAEHTNDFVDYQMLPDNNNKPYLQNHLTLSQLDEMRLRYWDVYKKGLEYVNAPLPPQIVQREIWKLVEWGVQNDEPMAIKLGEFYGQHLDQAAPLETTKLVADYYKYQLRIPDSQRKYDEAYAVVGPSNIRKVYNTANPVLARQLDYELLNHLEFDFQYRGHARALLKTSYSQQKYIRNGVTVQDVLQNIRQRQAIL